MTFSLDLHGSVYEQRLDFDPIGVDERPATQTLLRKSATRIIIFN